jgi:hypothetical protein
MLSRLGSAPWVTIGGPSQSTGASGAYSPPLEEHPTGLVLPQKGPQRDWSVDGIAGPCRQQLAIPGDPVRVEIVGLASVANVGAPAGGRVDVEEVQDAAHAVFLAGDQVTPVPIPHDCTDGVSAAYWRRPEAYLDPAVRAGMSGIALTDQAIVQRAVQHLDRDVRSGAWHERHGQLLTLSEIDAGYRIVAA